MLRFALLLSLLVIPAVAGIGIAQDYLEDGELIIAPGESTTHTVELQNVQNEEITVNLSVDSEYVSIDGEPFIVIDIPGDQVRTRIDLDVEIPEDTPLGTRERVAFSVRQLSSGDGNVNLGVRLRNDFTLVVQEPTQEAVSAQEQEPGNWPYILIAGIILVVIVIFVFTRSSLVAGRIRGSKYQELIDVIKHMSDKEFREFQEGGVLRSWIMAEVSNEQLRERLLSAKSRQQAITILRHEQ